MSGNDNQVTDIAKNGLITGIGIILGFVLVFLLKFSIDPSPWEPKDLLTLIPVSIGIALMTYSLYRAFIPYNQSIKYYEATAKIFIFGGVLSSFLGIVFAFFS